MKNNRIIAVLLLLATLLLFAGCAKDKNDDNLNLLPEGVVPEIWFDDLFIVTYPEHLADRTVYFSRTYIYGNPSEATPVIFMCSQELRGVSVQETGGEGEPYEVEKLEPNDALLIAAELGETPSVEVRFKDKGGKRHAYSLYRNAETGKAEYVKLEK